MKSSTLRTLARIAVLTPLLLGGFAASHLQAAEGIRLIVRGDDIGSSHAANVACIRAYKEGIVRSVEVMVPGPWFPEAAKMLVENPGLDVGVHLVLTSEWSGIKWRPLTHAPSLTDPDGYFFPMVWENRNLTPNNSLQKSKWNLQEIEKELRAQIETAKRHIPQISHLSNHMGFSGLDPAVAALEAKLAKEYGLELDLKAAKTQYMQHWGQLKTIEQRTQHFVRTLQTLRPGTYVFVEHPGLDVPEMQAIGHKGYEDVAADREAVTQVFTSQAVLKAIREKGIQLISFKDLKGGG